MTRDNIYRDGGNKGVRLTKEMMTADLNKHGWAAFEIELPEDPRLKLGEEIESINAISEITEIPRDKGLFDFENVALISEKFGVFKFTGKDKELGSMIGKTVWCFKNEVQNLTLVVSLNFPTSEGREKGLKFCLEAILENQTMIELNPNAKGESRYVTLEIKKG